MIEVELVDFKPRLDSGLLATDFYILDKQDSTETLGSLNVEGDKPMGHLDLVLETTRQYWINARMKTGMGYTFNTKPMPFTPIFGSKKNDLLNAPSYISTPRLLNYNVTHHNHGYFVIEVSKFKAMGEVEQKGTTVFIEDDNGDLKYFKYYEGTNNFFLIDRVLVPNRTYCLKIVHHGMNHSISHVGSYYFHTKTDDEIVLKSYLTNIKIGKPFKIEILPIDNAVSVVYTVINTNGLLDPLVINPFNNKVDHPFTNGINDKVHTLKIDVTLADGTILTKHYHFKPSIYCRFPYNLPIDCN